MGPVHYRHRRWARMAISTARLIKAAISVSTSLMVTGRSSRLTPNGKLTTLVKFNHAITGANPTGLTPGNDGNFYGTTQIGGSNGDGTIFRVTTNGTLTTLVNFSHAITGADPAVLTLGQGRQFLRHDVSRRCQQFRDVVQNDPQRNIDDARFI